MAIYRGMPGWLLGLSFSHYERTTDVAVDQLQPGVANRLKAGIRVDSVADAEALVKEYEEEISNRAASSNADAKNSGGEDGAKDASGAKDDGSTSGAKDAPADAADAPNANTADDAAAAAERGDAS